MRERAGVCWYEIQKCGYFKSSRAKQPDFGGVNQLLEDLSRWGRNKQLRETQTFSPGEMEPEDTQLPVYLLDIQGDRDDWLITLWNETPSSEGQVASVPMNAVVGKADVVMNKLPAGSVPGYATYFYFVPSLNAFAAIRFQHLIFGHSGARRYLGGFVRGFSRYVCFADQPAKDGTVEILGYAKDPSFEPENFAPYFRSEILRRPGEHDMLIHRARDVRKLIRRAELQNGRIADRHLWQALLERSGLALKKVLPPSVHMQYQVPTRLEPSEMSALIQQWEASSEEADEWGDIGFLLRGESSPHWLSKSVARTITEFDIDRENAEVVKSSSLLGELKRCRSDLIALIGNKVV